jgi:hypothetical protein
MKSAFSVFHSYPFWSLAMSPAQIAQSLRRLADEFRQYEELGHVALSLDSGLDPVAGGQVLMVGHLRRVAGEAGGLLAEAPPEALPVSFRSIVRSPGVSPAGVLSRLIVARTWLVPDVCHGYDFCHAAASVCEEAAEALASGAPALVDVEEEATSSSDDVASTSASLERNAIFRMLKARIRTVREQAEDAAYRDGRRGDAAIDGDRVEIEYKRLQPVEVLDDLVEQGIIAAPTGEADRDTLRKRIALARKKLGWLTPPKPSANDNDTDSVGDGFGRELPLEEDIPSGWGRCPRCTVGVARPRDRSCNECREDEEGKLVTWAKMASGSTRLGVELESRQASALDRWLDTPEGKAASKASRAARR